MNNPHKKILILGNGGSGKTWLAKKLASKFKLEILHLDKIYWSQGWHKKDESFFQQSVADFIGRDEWIIEGTPMPGIEARISQAKTIVFLDIPRCICLLRIIKRAISSWFINYHAVNIDGCPAVKISKKTLWWVWRFPQRQRPQIHALLNLADKKNKRIYIIRNKKDLKNLLNCQ